MEGIIPGVLSHHERVDGKGYPNRLNGNQIHLIGKVVSIADSFDAMTSRRIYREAMSIESAVEQIKKGIGTQFDEKIANAFLSSDIHALWEILQDGTSPVWGHSDIIEYSTEAVGVLVG
jgi:HD-GYP domain-containing protein (c-di-GMP phosphodiesterase class II)